MLFHKTVGPVDLGNYVHWFVPHHADEVVKPCCGPAVNPRIVSPAKSYDPAQAQFRIPRKLSNAALTCARPTTACVIDQRHGSRR